MEGGFTFLSKLAKESGSAFKLNAEIQNGDYINIIRMSKSQRKQVVYCVEHEFCLTPLRADVYLKQAATLSYCKGKIEVKNKGQQKKIKHQ